MVVSCSSTPQLSENQKKAQIYYSEGTTELVKGRYKDALKQLIEAEKLDAENPKILVNLGMAYYFMKKREVAIKKIERALEIDPKNTDARLNLGSFYQENKQYTQAMANYQEALKDLIYPQHFRTHYNMALIEKQNGNIELAQVHLEKSLEDRSNYCPSHYQLGLIHFQKKELQKALDSFSEAGLGTCVKNPDSFYYRAITLQSLGRVQDARKTFEFVRDQFPQSSYFSLANFHLQKIQANEVGEEAAYNSHKVFQPEPNNLLQSPILK